MEGFLFYFLHLCQDVQSFGWAILCKYRPALSYELSAVSAGIIGRAVSGPMPTYYHEKLGGLPEISYELSAVESRLT